MLNNKRNIKRRFLGEVSSLKEPILKLEAVTQEYHQGKNVCQAIKEASFTIYKGELVVILGASGSGKTTLLKLMSGIILPTKGRVIFDGAPISNYNHYQLTNFRREKIGFIFKDANLIGSLTVRENIELATELVRFPTDINQIISGVGLTEQSELFPGELSNSQQKRVALARAVAKNPAIIFGDEPTGELDYKNSMIILKLLKAINQATEKNVILVTDNPEITLIADRIIKLRSGEIIENIENRSPINLNEIVW